MPEQVTMARGKHGLAILTEGLTPDDAIPSWQQSFEHQADFIGPTLGNKKPDATGVGQPLDALASEGRFNLHVRELAGENDHHRVEAAFKALALALRQAAAIDVRSVGEIPSTKEGL